MTFEHEASRNRDSNVKFAPLAAIVLAAGSSHRIGPENKLLKPLGGHPLLSYTIETLAGLGLGQVVAVAGEDANEIGALLPPSFTLIENNEAAAGMGTSLAKGARSLNAQLRGVFIVLADMPFVERSDYERLAAAFASLGDNAICIPNHKAKRGHPVLFGRAHIPALTKLTQDRGGRSVLDENMTHIHDIAECSEGVRFDVDDPGAFAEAERKLQLTRDGLR